MDVPAIEIVGLRKDYRGLRPLRLERLQVAPGEIVALAGLDADAAEVLTDLLTGATLAEEGDVRVLGVATTDLAGPDAWLAFLDRFGIVSNRLVLLESLSVLQNVAVPLTLNLEPVPPEVAAAARQLAAEAGLDAASLDVRVADASPLVRLQVGLARAIAIGPRVLILEHPTLGRPPQVVPLFAASLLGLARRRRVSVLMVSGDSRLTELVADRALTLEPATGRLRERPRWARVFRRPRSS